MAAIVAAAWAQLAPAAEEADPRLHPDGQGWGFHRAPSGDPQLPRVLLIGDSIANGYHATVAAQLKGKAVVDVWVTGLHENSPELHDLLGKALANGPYAVVHFNIGLHGWPKGRIPEGQYDPLMRKYVAILREGAPGAKLIWASSTPITTKSKPFGLDPTDNPTIAERNASAAAIMRDCGIAVNDLYALVSGQLPLARGDRFHWQAHAYAQMGSQVARYVANALESSPRKESTP
jgi:hypothetical protein